ncbi:2OG-Fe(II) oxygenase [Mucilaginibacter sp.]|uniref:2OG-Fe(II) oxygenase family protein n=1 Tax=Mucilaginibacter sp. TaxID=1882438 RepID=UPI00262CA73A|nr:2OG-Fe(II) oxygenase [Mucilaginibacter sp.]MDB4922919.1 oxidoreductase [Mucilaginibacter sp.]
MNKIDDFYYKINLIETNDLPKGWAEEIENLVDRYSTAVFLDGNNPTSREPEETRGMTYHVITGDIIKKSLGWLYELYASRILEIANTISEEVYVADNDLVYAININALKKVGDRYERHVDTEELSAVLFVTDQDDIHGGQLLFHLKEDLIAIYPKSGDLILFDARLVEHEVTALKMDRYRISIPMGYYKKDTQTDSNDEIKSYLYQ